MAAVGFAVPMAGFNLGIGGVDFVEQAKQKRKGVFGNGIAVAFGRGNQRDVSLGRFGYIDAFEPGTHTR
jgi:hypothetical protein